MSNWLIVWYEWLLKMSDIEITSGNFIKRKEGFNSASIYTHWRGRRGGAGWEGEERGCKWVGRFSE